MSTEKMREEFQAAYVEGLIARCGEGFRSTAEYSLTERRPDGEYLHYPDFIAWWAWQASRAAIEVELPGCEVDVDPDHEDYEVMEQQECLAMLENHTLTRCRQAIESLGLRVKP